MIYLGADGAPRWIPRYQSSGPRRPRWKDRLMLLQVYIAPGAGLRLDPSVTSSLTYGMRRVHVQRRAGRRGGIIETWWGQRAEIKPRPWDDEPEPDYRELLKKYIAHVADEEGVSFIAGFHDGVASGRFTEEEWAELVSLNEESRRDYSERLRA